MEPAKKIKHLVIAGGGVSGLSAYGVLRESHRAGFWDINNIETIYGTSIGAILSVFLCLKYSWEDLDDYILKRPWQNVFKFEVHSAFRAYENRGIFDKKIIEELLLPLLKGNDMDQHSTLRDLYEKTNVTIHVNSTELNSYKIVDISHMTHPEWTVIDAVYCSACLPILFSPHLKDDECYIDGGTIMNYPLGLCIDAGNDPDTIFGITLARVDQSTNRVTTNSNLLDHMTVLLSKIYEYACYTRLTKHVIKYEIQLENNMISIYDIMNAASSYEQRLIFITKGVELWKTYSDHLFCSGNDQLC